MKYYKVVQINGKNSENTWDFRTKKEAKQKYRQLRGEVTLLYINRKILQEKIYIRD